MFVELADMKIVHQMMVEFKIKTVKGELVRGVVYPTVHTLDGQ